jgi:flagellar protein FliL
MATTEPEEQSKSAVAAPKKKSKLLMIVGLLIAVLGAGGGVYFFMQRTQAKKAAAAEDAKKPPASEESEITQVVELQPFIVNLADNEEARYLRMTVSLGISGTEAAEKTSPLFTTKVRNAMISVLTTKTSAQVLSSEGKTELRKQLLEAARTVSGEPHVRAIYITDFIIQM